MTTTTIQERARVIAARAPHDPAAERAWALCILSCPRAVSVEDYCARAGDTSCPDFPGTSESDASELPDPLVPRLTLLVGSRRQSWWRRAWRWVVGE